MSAVATRLRALADAPWVARGDAATQAALREGAAEIERMEAALRGQPWALSELADAFAAAEVERLRGLVDARAEVAVERRHEAAARASAWALAEVTAERDALRVRLAAEREGDESDCGEQVSRGVPRCSEDGATGGGGR